MKYQYEKIKKLAERNALKVWKEALLKVTTHIYLKLLKYRSNY